MGSQPQTIIGPHGRFTRQENGLIHFYKTDGVTIDEATALQYLESVRALDDSGTARVLVIQGKKVEYTFEAQHTLLTNKLLSGLAFVTQDNMQRLTTGLLRDLARAFRAKFPVGIFESVEEAEAWLLNGSNIKGVDNGHVSRENDFARLLVMESLLE
ncbi:MAG: hypothetical protein CL608_21135 [Anaerolineaceae bacterium]|nr:hypothetical protein [Anaerolineaceae bacterium]